MVGQGFVSGGSSGIRIGEKVIIIGGSICVETSPTNSC